MDIETFESKAEFRQSNKSHDFIGGNEDENMQKQYINTGSILHKIFSTIHTTADIDGALAQLENEGVLYDDTLSRDKLLNMLRQRLKDPRVTSWFSDKWQLFNECSIISVDENNNVVEHRPDRVMTDGREMIVVDFKFGRPAPEYNEQVLQYMNLLSAMGHTNIKGYLWFVYSNIIEEVK